MFGFVKKSELEKVQSQLDDVLKKNKELEKKINDPEVKLALTFSDIKSKIKDEEEAHVAEMDEKRKNVENLNKKIDRCNKTLSHLQTEIINHDLISTITPYEKLLDGPTSKALGEKLSTIKDKQKELIKSGNAFVIEQDLYFNNRLASGRAHQKRLGKFLITSFNAVADSIIAKTTAKDFASSAKEMVKWFDRVNKGGVDHFVRMQKALLNLRLEEHRYACEYKIKKEIEEEEQRYVREAIREENKVKKEIEKFVKDREKEEKSYQKDLDEAILKIQSAKEAELENLNKQVEKLKAKLEIARKEKERAMSMAQLTRSGYVYVLSNKGSFGSGVYKIGMTRRLDPMDRVRELGDASVPFFFDVHGLIPSDDAPGLEKMLHDKFASRRVNKINYRREFFKVSLEEIEAAFNEMADDNIELIYHAAAEQYEETLAMEAENEQKSE